MSSSIISSHFLDWISSHIFNVHLNSRFLDQFSLWSNSKLLMKLSTWQTTPCMAWLLGLSLRALITTLDLPMQFKQELFGKLRTNVLCKLCLWMVLYTTPQIQVLLSHELWSHLLIRSNQIYQRRLYLGFLLTGSIRTFLCVPVLLLAASKCLELVLSCEYLASLFHSVMRALFWEQSSLFI